MAPNRQTKPSKEASMKRTPCAAAVALCLTLPFAAMPAFAQAQPSKTAPGSGQAPSAQAPSTPTPSGSAAKGTVTIEYDASTKFPAVAGRLKQRMVLEELQQFLVPLGLPKDLKIVAKDC